MKEEIELKLELANHDELDRLRSHLGCRLESSEQVNIYFDTADAAFRKLHVGLRVRWEHHQLSLTFKSRGSIEDHYSRRVEVERRLPPEAWISILRGEYDVANQLRALESSLPIDLSSVDLDTVEVAGTLHNIRSVYPLPGEGESLQVEIDETEYPDFSLGWEVELEILPNSDRTAASNRLHEVFRAAQVQWRPSSTSKLARLYRVLDAMAS